MLKQIILLCSLLVCTSSITAQTRKLRPVRCVKPELKAKIIRTYTDSLKFYGKKLEAERLEAGQTREAAGYPLDGRYARLFTPIAFYKDLAHRHFSLDPDETSITDDQLLIDNILLNIYIHRPEFVTGKVQAPGPAEKPKKKKEDKADEQPQLPTSHQGETIAMPNASDMKFNDFDLVVVKPNFWTTLGEASLQFMQNYYSPNWYQGGESNYSALTSITLQANYNNKQKVKFDNKLEMKLGFMTTRSDQAHKVKPSSDLLRLTSKLGLQASKKWYYTLQVVATSQFAKSFAANSNDLKSAFLSPAIVNASLGMDYKMSWLKGKMTGSIYLAPIATNYKYVSRDELAVRNGIEEGKHSMTDYGSTFTLDGTWKISNNVSWKTRLYGYTTYKRVELQWENTINMKVSRFISTNIYIYPRYDDSRAKDRDYGHFQLKEYISLGVDYSF